MNIAIVVGVSTYSDASSSLPACGHDVALMEALLRGSQKYTDHLLCIPDATKSSVVKERIVSFIREFATEDIEEVFYYFSGHGDFPGDDFYFLLGDFDSARRKQTTITNSELDSWLRLLSPQLTIKVVDACHAGVQYIKDAAGALEKHLSDRQKGLGDCYFLFSSQQEQSSYQDAYFSYFTRRIAEAVKDFASDQIRYRDIMDSVSDAFAADSRQNPYFITQASNTEVFCEVTTELRDAIAGHLQVPTTGGTPGKASARIPAVVTGGLSLMESVKNEAATYCTEAEVLDAVQELPKLAKEYKYPEEFTALFRVIPTNLDELPGQVPKIQDLGEWLRDNPSDYFARVTYGTETWVEEVEKPAWEIQLEAMQAFGGRIKPTRNVTKSMNIVTGFSHTQEVPFKGIELVTEPQFLNLSPHACWILYVFSKQHIRLFYFYGSYRELNWKDRTVDEGGTWQTRAALIKDGVSISRMVNDILDGFVSAVMTPIKKRFLEDSGDKERRETDQPEASRAPEPSEEATER